MNGPLVALVERAGACARGWRSPIENEIGSHFDGVGTGVRVLRIKIRWHMGHTVHTATKRWYNPIDVQHRRTRDGAWLYCKYLAPYPTRPTRESCSSALHLLRRRSATCDRGGLVRRRPPSAAHALAHVGQRTDHVLPVVLIVRRVATWCRGAVGDGMRGLGMCLSASGH